MSVHRSARSSSRRLLGALALGLFLLLLAGAGLTWRILRQERVVAVEQSRERLEELADLTVVALRASLVTLEQQVAALATEGTWSSPSAQTLAAPDVVAFVESEGAGDVRPPDAILYADWYEETSTEGSSTFLEADRLELGEHDSAGALARLRELVRADDSAVRGGALVRIARIQRAEGRDGAAARTEAELEQLDPTRIAGVPAGLLALSGRCSRSASAADAGQLRACAEELRSRLFAAAWRLSPGAFDFYRAESERWLESSGAALASNPEESRRLAASAAVSSAWRQGRDERSPYAGTRNAKFGDEWAVVVWHRGAAGVAGAVASASYFARRLDAEIAPALRRRAAGLSLVQPEGTPWLELGEPGSGVRVVRTAAESEIPWNLWLTSSVASWGEIVRRQWLVPGAFAAAILVTLMAAYAAYRATSRELEIARLQSEFVAAVSHEFRSPLASLRQMGELLEESRFRDEAQRRRYLGALKHETRRLQRLVDDLLDFRRMESGALQFRMSPTDGAALVRAVVDEFQAEPTVESRVIRCEGEGAQVPISADRDALSRALWNLIDNAVKYSPDGGEIRVRARRAESSAELSVTDQGIGIAADERTAIFGRFVRGRGAETASAQGTGLGLALVQQIVEAHGGRVGVESEVGRGSTFTIHLPLVEEPT